MYLFFLVFLLQNIAAKCSPNCKFVHSVMPFCALANRLKEKSSDFLTFFDTIIDLYVIHIKKYVITTGMFVLKVFNTLVVAP